MLTDDLYLLAQRDGWRKLFFTNKIKLKVSKNTIKSMSKISLKICTKIEYI